MPGIGGGNPFPLELGGGPSSSEKMYQSLKDAIGIGAAGDDGTMDADWRMAQARGVSAASNVQRAVNQGWPHLATDFIEVYEGIFYLVAGDLSDEERRQKVVDRWTRSIDASGPGVEADLQGIDPLFSVVAPDHEISTVTNFGRGFEDVDPNGAGSCGPAFGGNRSSTAWPNYSTEFKSYVQYDLTSGEFTQEAKRRMERAKEVLCEVSPAWVDFVIFVGSAGFILDQSLLDAGAFG